MTDKIRMGALSGRRLLVVEDRYLVASELEAQLCAYGAEVLGPCASLEAALAVVDQADGAVLDVDLWGQAAYPLAERLSGRNRAFVFLTGYDVEDRPQKWADVAWLQKPCDPYDVVAALATALDRA